MIDYHDLVGERVKVTDKDGNVFVGPIIDYIVGLDADRDYDSIGVQTQKGMSIDIPIPDIVSCEVLED